MGRVFAPALLVLVLMACGSDTADRYEQTWAKAYGDTTCGEYVDAMTGRERMIMAGDILLRVWRRDDPDSRIPSDDEMTSFAAAIGLGCADNVIASGISGPAEMAAYLYALDESWQPRAREGSRRAFELADQIRRDHERAR